MSRRESNPLYKLIVLGDGGVGKTALTIQLCLNHFVETYDPTIEDSYRKQVMIDDQPATLEVLDTAGQEEYTALRDQWIRDGEGFILVYSITSRSSFSRIKNYYSQIERVKDEDPFAIVLVGNKSDRKGERQVSEQDGEQLARELGDNVAFFESSAKLNINIEKAFFECARKCRVIRHPETNPQGGPNSNNNLADVHSGYVDQGLGHGGNALGNQSSQNAGQNQKAPANQAHNRPSHNAGTSSQSHGRSDTRKAQKKKSKCIVM
ncbi:Ras family GTPase RAS2 [Sugiyamaella lignohabitans]|uniref:Ras family GTPase RAS2 n=1 Tax=Sugiyamaella lignohabitans TaxID=796027 RepID=A0A167BZ50_9ASCO|nr:Ras family GTPase RAS2 [Sugiyamaella lignohabitans]ANB11004.1 Ras family GTPase RAS2 [Sugiyamaella lignohabitans]